ncbi:MAG: hypothetical protein M0R75_10845 [Dehalococcoidia bacterium]|nr:hypothetical protein [Dehalococcoidia bacterium]
MTQRPLTIPTWAPAAAAIGFVVWAVSIWWMVATLDTAGDTGAIEDALDAVAAELESADAQIEGLGGQVAALEEERNALVARIDGLESRSAGSPVAFQLSGADAEDDTTVGDAEAEASPFFTDGADRYNCRDFTSMAEAQEAFEVNGPDDPNRIDTNRNGQACEDFKYGSGAAAAVVADDEGTPEG